MDASGYREEIYDVFADSDGDVETRIGRALEIGTNYLGLPIAFLTRIEDGRQVIVASRGDHALIQPGESCPLEQAYCRRTIETEDPMAVQDANVSPSVSQQAVETFGLGAYIGVTVTVDDETYGTVCFAAESTRDEPFTEAEQLFLELIGKLAGQAIERRAHERELERRAERLEREKARFEGIAETSADILFRVDSDATFTYVSSAAEDVLGYAPSEMVGTPFTAWLAESAVDDGVDTFERVMRGETTDGTELHFTDADGETVIIAVNGTPIREDGTVVGVQGVGRDVTARKERERELRRKTRAIDETQLGISMADATDPDLPLVYVNEGFERITGYERQDVLGRNCRFLQGPATDSDHVDVLRARVEAETTATVELLNYRADGTPFWNQVTISPIEEEDGALSHYLGFQRDVTERKRTEQLVLLLNRVLRHNLRNDMNVVRGSGRLLRDDPPAELTPVGERIERIDGVRAVIPRGTVGRTPRQPERTGPQTGAERPAGTRADATRPADALRHGHRGAPGGGDRRDADRHRPGHLCGSGIGAGARRTREQRGGPQPGGRPVGRTRGRRRRRVGADHRHRRRPGNRRDGVGSDRRGCGVGAGPRLRARTLVGQLDRDALRRLLPDRAAIGRVGDGRDASTPRDHRRRGSRRRRTGPDRPVSVTGGHSPARSAVLASAAASRGAGVTETGR
jgi:PAS domain S-box-containing protein